MTLGSHQRCVGKSQSHFTPKWILDVLGPFDLDPCAGEPRPWDCATENWVTNGLRRKWPKDARVWLNPPFNRYEVARWIAHLAYHHCNGIALVHARTETEWFAPIWRTADAILFLADRIHFCTADGIEQKANSGAPAVLAAWGKRNSEILSRSRLSGFLVRDRLLLNVEFPS